MNEPKSLYITTTLPYVNAPPHIGFALEIIHADIFARYHTLKGRDVFFNTGTDEHGLKIWREAKKEGKNVQDYVNSHALKFKGLRDLLNLSESINFLRTIDQAHVLAAQEFWRRCDVAGDIYKKLYKIKYCVGCELEKTDSELENGRCPIHPNIELEIIEEENYFFRFSKYADMLLDLYKERPDFVVPEFRFNEIKVFVGKGLEDFSISRLVSKMPWGAPVPNDPAHVMFVWFDALVNYVSAIGWPSDMRKFEKYWPVIQFAGKDQIRQQAAMWQAMLMSAGLSPSKQIVIHGFITSGGQKMSKSQGNVIDPYEIVKEYGTDALRYYLARHTHPFEDSDFTMEKFKDAYNANLAHGLGNLASRIFKLASNYGVRHEKWKEADIPEEFSRAVESYEFNKAADYIWSLIGAADKKIEVRKPFKKIKTDEAEAKKDVLELLSDLQKISFLLGSFLPDTSRKIEEAFTKNNALASPLFARRN